LNWLNQLIFWIPLVVTVGVLLWLFREDILKASIPVPKLKKAIIIVIGVTVLQYLSRIGLFYWSLRKDPLGMYLLPAQGTNYFIQSVSAMTKVFLLNILVAIGLVFIVILIKRLTQRPLFEESDLYVIFLASFLVGFPGIFILFMAAFLLMIIWQLAGRLVFKTVLNQSRLRVSPFLIFVALIHLVLVNFYFYQNFLGYVHLI